MSSQSISCPHCGQPIVNDGSLAGQLVMCPICHSQLQMPAPDVVLPPPVLPQGPPATSVPPPFISDSPEIIRRPQRISHVNVKRRKPSPNPLIATLIILFAITALSVAVIGSRRSSGSKDAPDTWYDKGYNLGYESGQIDRNDGSRFNPMLGDRVAFYLEDKGLTPRMGTPEYGDFLRGYERGYSDGYR